MGSFNGTDILCSLLLSSTVVVGEGKDLFLALSNFVLLKASLQLWWYFALFCLNVLPIPLPSSNLTGSSGMGMKQWDICSYVPIPVLFRTVGVWWGLQRLTFFHLLTETAFAPISFPLRVCCCGTSHLNNGSYRPRDYPLTAVYPMCTFMYGIQLGS